MRERPILFKPEMVRAILEGRKTETRRTSKLDVINKAPDKYRLAYQQPFNTWEFRDIQPNDIETERHVITCPYGGPGDQLWVSGKDQILLEVLSVKVERLQDIKKKGAFAEGVVQINKSFLMDPEAMKQPVEYSNVTKLNDETYWGYDNPVGAFAAYFEEICGPEAWNENPWVWVIQFKRIPQPPGKNDAFQA